MSYLFNLQGLQVMLTRIEKSEPPTAHEYWSVFEAPVKDMPKQKIINAMYRSQQGSLEAAIQVCKSFLPSELVTIRLLEDGAGSIQIGDEDAVKANDPAKALLIATLTHLIKKSKT